MLMGFVAVFAAIFYKINSSDGTLGEKTLPETIVLGADADVLDVELSDGRLLVLTQEKTAKVLLYIDPATGAVIGRTRLLSGSQ